MTVTKHDEPDPRLKAEEREPPAEGNSGGGTVLMPSLPTEVLERAESSDDLEHSLVVTQGPEKGRRIRIGDQPVTMGRSCGQVDLADPAISGSHCRVTLSSGSLMVEDLRSSNGTRIDGRQIHERTELPIGRRLTVGSTVMLHELRSRSEVEQHAEIDQELDRAAYYVESLLPQPLKTEHARLDYLFKPCSKLGGDTFSFQWLDEEHLAIYLIDVCGHGVRSALHSVSAVQQLRSCSLPDVDFRQPSEVLEGLNKIYQMEQHGGMYFTAWYGVYLRRERRLRYASAGHPPALLTTGSERRQLGMRQPFIGMMEEVGFQAQEVEVPEPSRLFVFSDGTFELIREDGRDWTLDELLDLLAASDQSSAEDALEAIEKTLCKIQGHDRFEDDLSIIVADF